MKNSRLFGLHVLLLLSGCGENAEPEQNLSAQMEASVANMERLANETEALAASQNSNPDVLSRDGVSLAAFPRDLSERDAQQIISLAGHRCARVVQLRADKFAPLASCEDGERYLLNKIIEPVRQDLAMKCSAMAKLGVEGC